MNKYTTCPTCNWSTSQVREQERPGCAQCFITHADLLRETFLANELLFSQHQSQLDELQDKLYTAIQDEDFEKASLLRDQITSEFN